MKKMRYVILILCCMLLSSCALGGREEQTGTQQSGWEDKTAATGGGVQGAEEANKPYPEVEDKTGKSHPLEDDENISKLVEEVSKLYKGVDEKKIKKLLGEPNEVITMDNLARGRTSCEIFCFDDGQIIIYLFNNKLDYAMWSSKDNNDYGNLIPIKLGQMNDAESNLAETYN